MKKRNTKYSIGITNLRNSILRLELKPTDYFTTMTWQAQLNATVVTLTLRSATFNPYVTYKTYALFLRRLPRQAQPNARLAWKKSGVVKQVSRHPIHKAHGTGRKNG